MMSANKPRLKKDYPVCQMRPLRDCLKANNNDVSQCINEVKLFEETCSKKVNYIHDRDGLDDNKSPLFSGQKRR